ncbi:hypothetical protein PEDI_38380 [Persicobacter diffluens]|uniref:Uncharacterized protein n=1 Tax=Persicobacter diffluens TaxID=981 RepID=A0AAN4W228_9BACT|nr:hypothetical protein PEDI_38380 [Persicobacter diffluens]
MCILAVSLLICLLEKNEIGNDSFNFTTLQLNDGLSINNMGKGQQLNMPVSLSI